jgi:hypothetical protein
VVTAAHFPIPVIRVGRRILFSAAAVDGLLRVPSHEREE